MYYFPAFCGREEIPDLRGGKYTSSEMERKHLSGHAAIHGICGQDLHLFTFGNIGIYIRVYWDHGRWEGMGRLWGSGQPLPSNLMKSGEKSSYPHFLSYGIRISVLKKNAKRAEKYVKSGYFSMWRMWRIWVTSYVPEWGVQGEKFHVCVLYVFVYFVCIF